MKQLAAMAWKEWHEVRAFLWIAMGVFIGLPAVAGFEATLQYSKTFELFAMPWVFAFGGVLAVFVAVGATCRDFNGHLEDFWRSRPVSTTRWLIVKYFVGLIVVLVSCGLPLLLEAAPSLLKDFHFRLALWTCVWFPFLWTAPYSFGFLAGCLIRRTAHAAMLALAAMLLVYFLPVVIPPLDWLSVTSLGSDVGSVKFVAGMFGLAVVVLSLSLFAVNNSWRIESGQKMMYGSIALAILILFASASYQLGTNMSILQQASLPPSENVSLIRYEGNQGFFLTQRFSHPRPDDSWQVNTEYRTVKLTPSGIQLGLSHPVDGYATWVWPSAATPSGHPEITYRAEEFVDFDHSKIQCTLTIGKLDPDLHQTVLPLWEQAITDRGQSYDNWTVTYVLKNRLYVIGRRIITLDITDPVSPKVIPTDLISYSLAPNGAAGTEKIIQPLPPVPDLSPRQRLEATFNFMSSRECFEGDTLCEFFNDTLFAYRLTKLTETAATFEKVGEYDPTILESAFGSFNYGDMLLKNGLLYVTSNRYTNDPWRWGRTWRTPNPHITVFDTRGPKPLRLVGHFAAPGAAVACPLPDGNVLVGGDHLWLVGPPPRRDGN